MTLCLIKRWTHIISCKKLDRIQYGVGFAHPAHNALRIPKTKETNDVSILRHIIENMNLYFDPHEKIFFQTNSVPSCWNYSRIEVSKIFQHNISYLNEDEVPPDMSQTSSIFNWRDSDTIYAILENNSDTYDCPDRREEFTVSKPYIFWNHISMIYLTHFKIIAHLMNSMT